LSSITVCDSTTGVLNLIGKLDRDRPNGREIYQFNIEAVDEPGSITRLTGYATVQIKPQDINDNAPVFTPANPTGSVDENSGIGIVIFNLICDMIFHSTISKFIWVSSIGLKKKGIKINSTSLNLSGSVALAFKKWHKNLKHISRGC
jgi:hypothetical protein